MVTLRPFVLQPCNEREKNTQTKQKSNLIARILECGSDSQSTIYTFDMVNGHAYVFLSR